MELKEKKLQREILSQDQALESHKKILQKCKYIANPPISNVYTTDYYPIKGAYSTLPNPKHSPKSKILEIGKSHSREKKPKNSLKGKSEAFGVRKVDFEDPRHGQGRQNFLSSSNFFFLMRVY
jgi:hypothetical protein